jgi:hypothetical protein
MNNRTLWVLLCVLAAALVGGTVIWLRPRLVATPTLVAVPESGCDLRHGPCTGRFPSGGEVTLEVTPVGIPPLKPLTLIVQTRNLEVNAVAIDFSGTDMDMGFNRPSLTPDGAGRFRGEGMLPVCVSPRMGWEAQVLLTTPNGLLVAPFRFDTQR